MAHPPLDAPAPEFSLPQTGDTPNVSLSELRGQQVVLYFYPRDATPGCTTESQDFRDAITDFAACNTVILGISQDSLKSHEKFKSKQSLPFELISDEAGAACQAYDVIRLKKMYGKEFEGIERSTFLIDADGVLRSEWRKVKVPGHVAEVLQAAQALSSA